MGYEGARQSSAERRRLERALGRVLAEIMGEGHRDALHEALADARLRAIPDRPEELLFFVSGALYESVQRRLSSDHAEHLLTELRPVLDAAWEADRRRVVAAPDAEGEGGQPVSGMKRRSSATRRAVDTRHPIESGIHQARPSPELTPPATPASDVPRASHLEHADTLPSQHEPDISWLPDDELPPVVEVRRTLPYLPTVLLPSNDRPVVLLVHAREELRRELAARLRMCDVDMATAPTLASARAIFGRIEPDLVIADIETVAPDFAPLRAALDELFADRSPAPVLLLNEGRRHDEAPAVRAELDSQDPDDVVAVIDRWLTSAHRD